MEKYSKKMKYIDFKSRKMYNASVKIYNIKRGMVNGHLKLYKIKFLERRKKWIRTKR